MLREPHGHLQKLGIYYNKCYKYVYFLDNYTQVTLWYLLQFIMPWQ